MTDTQKNQSSENVALLPADTKAAVEAMIRITKDLTEIMGDETTKLSMNDALGALMLEYPKESAVSLYERAVAEFKNRHGEFRGRISTADLDRLEAAQQDLKKATEDNMAINKPVSIGVQRPDEGRDGGENTTRNTEKDEQTGS